MSGFFGKLLPIAGALGLGLLAPEILPALGMGGAAAGAGASAAGAAGAAGAGAAGAAGAGSLAGAAGGAAAAVPTATATAATAAAPTTMLGRIGTWLGGHPMEGLEGVGMLSQMAKGPGPTGPMPLQPSPILSAAPGGGAPARMGTGPGDLGFQQALISGLRR